ncbi:hypothetical protein HWV62_28742 [Athelia sp. TMB]|nr:hypothetical protein HWV62_28742 [Athelia sp. TMB]
MAIPYCQVFLNRQSTAAHTIIFNKIEEIVQMDMGAPLKWRHLHANSLDDHVGILQWAGDQHAGQAKDVNLEGKFFSLLGGVKKGHYFDNMKLQSLERNLTIEDECITSANKWLKSTHENAVEASTQLSQVLSQSRSQAHDGKYKQQVAKAEKWHGTAEAGYVKAVAASMEVKGKGSGRVTLLLPKDVIGRARRHS